MENIQQTERYLLAQKKVKKIRGFYIHSFFYVAVNAIILVQIYLKTDNGFWQWKHFTTPIFWGVGLLIHGLSVFTSNLIFGRNWEERKIQQLMNNEKNEKWE